MGFEQTSLSHIQHSQSCRCFLFNGFHLSHVFEFFLCSSEYPVFSGKKLMMSRSSPCLKWSCKNLPIWIPFLHTIIFLSEALRCIFFARCWSCTTLSHTEWFFAHTLSAALLFDYPVTNFSDVSFPENDGNDSDYLAFFFHQKPLLF